MRGDDEETARPGHDPASEKLDLGRSGAAGQTYSRRSCVLNRGRRDAVPLRWWDGGPARFFDVCACRVFCARLVKKKTRKGCVWELSSEFLRSNVRGNPSSFSFPPLYAESFVANRWFPLLVGFWWRGFPCVCPGPGCSGALLPKGQQASSGAALMRGGILRPPDFRLIWTIASCRLIHGRLGHRRSDVLAECVVCVFSAAGAACPEDDVL